jgi:drug/metabolite transporter (DMT)-like permease
MTIPISRFRLISSLSVGIAAASFASLFIRFAQARGMPTLTIAAWRLIFACLVLLPYAWTTHCKEIRALSGKEWGLVIASGICLGLHFATWIVSLSYTSVASSVVLGTMGPVFVGLGSWLFLKERLALLTGVGIVLAALGSIIIGWSDIGEARARLFGDFLALAGSVFVAGYLMIGRKVRAHRSLTAYIGTVYGIAMLTLLAIVLCQQQPLLGFHPVAYAWALALGLIPQLIGHTTLNWALHHLSATFVSIVTLAEPIGAGLLAYLILQETPTTVAILGGIFVLVGIYIASRTELAAKCIKEVIDV